MTRTGDREIVVVSGILPDNSGELACMKTSHQPHFFIPENCISSYFGLSIFVCFLFVCC